MPGLRQYHEKCVCGATIKLSESFDFVSSGELAKRFDNWRYEHKDCLTLFHQIQTVRMKQLERAKLKMLKE